LNHPGEWIAEYDDISGGIFGATDMKMATMEKGVSGFLCTGLYKHVY